MTEKWAKIIFHKIAPRGGTVRDHKKILSPKIGIALAFILPKIASPYLVRQKSYMRFSDSVFGVNENNYNTNA